MPLRHRIPPSASCDDDPFLDETAPPPLPVSLSRRSSLAPTLFRSFPHLRDRLPWSALRSLLFSMIFFKQYSLPPPPLTSSFLFLRD